MEVEGAMLFARPVKTTAQIFHDTSNVALPPGGSMDSVVASTSKFDRLAALTKETSVVMSTVSVHPGSARGPVFADTSVKKLVRMFACARLGEDARWRLLSSAWCGTSYLQGDKQTYCIRSY